MINGQSYYITKTERGYEVWSDAKDMDPSKVQEGGPEVRDLGTAGMHFLFDTFTTHEELQSSLITLVTPEELLPQEMTFEITEK